METTNPNAVDTVVARLVPYAQWLNILTKHFGRYMMIAENMVYQFTRRLVSEYTRGY